MYRQEDDEYDDFGDLAVDLDIDGSAVMGTLALASVLAVGALGALAYGVFSAFAWATAR